MILKNILAREKHPEKWFRVLLFIDFNCWMTTLQVEIVCIEFDFVSNRMLFSWTMDTSCRWNLMGIQMHSHHYTSALGSRSKFKFDMFAFPSTSKCFQSPWIPRPILWRISCLQKVVWGAGHKLCYLTCFRKAYLLLSNTSSSFHWTLVSAQLWRWKQGMLSFRLLLWDQRWANSFLKTEYEYE